MRKVIVAVLVLAGGAAAWYAFRPDAVDTEAAATTPPATNGRSGGGTLPGGRPAMTVDTAVVSRHEIAEFITVVGNLIGEATVDVVPRVGGRIANIAVKMGDRVAKNQPVAKMEDNDIKEQVNQAQANLEVNKANVTARESDLKAAEMALNRQKSLFANGGLTSKANLDDADAKYNSAVAAVTVAKAQLQQTQGRVDELKVTLGNTNIVSPVDGFVSRRNLDQGAFAGTNTPLISVVDISTVRLVANLIEKDFRRVQQGAQAVVEVDAFPGEKFTGEVSRVAPVFDAATRTAAMEIEVPNPGFRLKPGMYARVQLTVDRRDNALTLPRNAVVDIEGKHGVFTVDGQTARFKEVRTGLQDPERVEVIDGLDEGQKVVTTGALALRDGDKITLVGQNPGQGKGRGRGNDGGKK